MISPFLEDRWLSRAAEICQLDLTRVDAIEVTDMKALEAAGLTRVTPDYSRIRKLLKDGVEVAGARISGVEYVLKRVRK